MSDKTGSMPSPAQPFEAAMRGRNVLVTGHTGFTGGWLCLWLEALGARVHGLALEPITTPSLFEAAAIGTTVASRIGDIRNMDVVGDAFRAFEPEIVFHLAAQPLVSRAFDDPLESFGANVMGTAHVLEAARSTASVKAVVCVTTDKVYEDRNWHWGYRETDRLGGKDPYAASKAAAELVAGAYQLSLASRGNKVAIATARGGNIIGGGDWSRDRIVPDFVRARIGGNTLELRNPKAVRPWQHVLALAHGYIQLAAALIEKPELAVSAWNFGPSDGEARSVGSLVEAMSAAWSAPQITFGEGWFPETRLLRVDSTKARAELGWRPPLSFEDTVALTASWYRDFHEGGRPARAICQQQIADYRARLAETP